MYFRYLPDVDGKPHITRYTVGLSFPFNLDIKNEITGADKDFLTLDTPGFKETTVAEFNEVLNKQLVKHGLTT